jgi:hypothetical protein
MHNTTLQSVVKYHKYFISIIYVNVFSFSKILGIGASNRRLDWLSCHMPAAAVSRLRTTFRLKAPRSAAKIQIDVLCVLAGQGRCTDVQRTFRLPLKRPAVVVATRRRGGKRSGGGAVELAAGGQKPRRGRPRAAVVRAAVVEEGRGSGAAPVRRTARRKSSPPLRTERPAVGNARAVRSAVRTVGHRGPSDVRAGVVAVRTLRTSGAGLDDGVLGLKPGVDASKSVRFGDVEQAARRQSHRCMMVVGVGALRRAAVHRGRLAGLDGEIGEGFFLVRFESRLLGASSRERRKRQAEAHFKV